MSDPDCDAPHIAIGSDGTFALCGCEVTDEDIERAKKKAQEWRERQRERLSTCALDECDEPPRSPMSRYCSHEHEQEGLRQAMRQIRGGATER